MADEKKATDDKRLAESRKAVEERVAKAYEHETPTPTQEEADAAKLAAMGQPDLPTDPGAPIDQDAAARRSAEADKPGGYTTRSTRKE